MVITCYDRIGWIMSIFEIVLYFAHLKYNMYQPKDKNKLFDLSGPMKHRFHG